MESSELASFWSKPGEEGREENKQRNNQTTSFSYRKTISQKKKEKKVAWMKTVPAQEYAAPARQRQDPRSDRAMPQTQEKALSIATPANTSSLRKERERETPTHTHTHKRGRAPGPEQTTSQKRGIKEDSLSSRVYNPALYQVLKTRGRL
jgi:hypothetical protein